MFCEKCGKEMKEGTKFCENCGNPLTPQPAETNKDISTCNTISVDTKSAKMPVVIIIAVIAIILISIGVVAFDKSVHNNGDEKINDIKNSYFEFLPEMTVGDLIYEYYGENYWACNSDDVIEFWGTNQKDKSGLALHFSEVSPQNTVEVTYRKYHKEDETAHDISQEQFENYMLYLYSLLDDTNENTTTKTKTTAAKQTTAKTKKTTTAVTTTAKKKETKKPEKSEKYLAYLTAMNNVNAEIDREYNRDMLTYSCYYLYDINKDGTYELLVQLGDSEAETMLMVISLDKDGELLPVGEMGGGHTWLSEKDGKLYSNFGYKGIQKVEEIVMYEDLGSWIVVTKEVSEQSGLSDYTTYGTAVKAYDMSDTSALEALCPADALKNNKYISSSPSSSGGKVTVYSCSKSGQLNCHGGTVAGFTKNYVVDGGAVGKVRSSLGDKWHVTAYNYCNSMGITWYELWDSDDGDYYGWVDANFIDFY